jgi:hypothetical protein
VSGNDKNESVAIPTPKPRLRDFAATTLPPCARSDILFRSQSGRCQETMGRRRHRAETARVGPRESARLKWEETLDMSVESSREAIGVFHDERNLQKAADELLIAGFDRSAFSLLAGHHAVENKLGHAYQKVVDIEDDGQAPRIAYIGSDSRVEAKGAAVGGLAYVGAVVSCGMVVASGGTALVAVAAAAAAGGVGGLIGAALARFMDKHHARYLEVQLEKGGLLLWVHVKDGEQERLAMQILQRNGAEDVHMHGLPAIDYAATQGGMSRDLSFMKRIGL